MHLPHSRRENRTLIFPLDNLKLKIYTFNLLDRSLSNLLDLLEND
jgi:hypothetical protein